MNLKRNFRFCSNNQAVILTFKYCKAEQFIYSQQSVKDVLSQNQTNCMAMLRKMSDRGK